MANEQNLKPSEYHLSREEAKKGGKASGEARRRKKTMREALQNLLETQAADKIKAKMESAGLDMNDADYQQVMLASQMLQAIKGNTRAAVWLSEIMGERIQNVKIDQKIDDSRKELEAYFAGKETEST